MRPPFQFVAPDRLQIRQGGGCMSVFGIPFFAAGVFLTLAVVGIVPVSNASELPALVWPLLVLMGVAFTVAGGALVFGRSWTIVDRAQRQVIKQWGLLLPLHKRIVPFDGSTAITMGFIEGDSDSADRFPIALKTHAGPDLQLCTFTKYAEARECAKALAEHLQLEIEDASTDHAIRLRADQIDIPLQQRLAHQGRHQGDVVRPADARSQVTREIGAVKIEIPPHPMNGLVAVAGLIPLAIPLVFGPPLATFFRESQTPDPVGWAFLAFLTFCFGILPTITIVGAFLRSRRGATIIEASTKGLKILERGAWKTRTIASLDAAEILDVDYSSRESSVLSAKRVAEQRALQAYPSADPSMGGRVDRVLKGLTRFAKANGVTIKTRKGLTTFGKELADEEIRYLHALIREALLK